MEQLKAKYKLLLPAQIRFFFPRNINDFQQTQVKLRTNCDENFKQQIPTILIYGLKS